MSTFIPVWIIGGPFIGLLFLSFAFKGPSSMGGTAPRFEPRRNGPAIEPSAPSLDPVNPSSPRRFV